MFKPSEHIVHPRHGAGTMTGIRTIERDGEKCRYYCIELVDDRGTVMIPVDYIEEAGLRSAVVDVRLLRRVLRKPPVELPSDYRVRQSHLRKKIASGDPRQIIQAVRDLCWYERQRKLTSVDAQLKARALLLLTYELAVKSALDVEAARKRLNKIIRQAMQGHEVALERAS
jgi:RNA polymerase-interacting CarD/CdnL/TRCF family regulator